MSRVYVAAEKNIKNAVVNNKKMLMFNKKCQHFLLKKIVIFSKNKKYKGNKF